MIIAEIGNEKFKLKNIQQAEQILSILHDAEIVDDMYLPDQRKYIWHSDDKGAARLRVQIVSDQEIVTLEKAQSIRNNET